MFVVFAANAAVELRYPQRSISGILDSSAEGRQKA